MSERTQENKNAEANMAYILIIAVVIISLPIALSFLRNAVSIVAFLLQAAPFILMTCGIGGLIYVSKKDK